MNKIKTCGKCEFVRVSRNRLFTVAYCSKTDDELIVPHEWRGGDVIHFSRVPDFCTSENAEKSKKPQPLGKWDSISVFDLI